MPRSHTLLSIDHLAASIGDKEIVHDVSLTVKPGEIHAIMGPNGSGKSTLVNVLMGHPSYSVHRGSVTFHGKDLLSLDASERAREGLFLAFQYPKEIAGVTLRNFLFAAYQAQQQARDPNHKRLSPVAFAKLLTEEMRALHIDPSFADRAINKGFSGGEKKKAEILQLKILAPHLALLDETDSGLDVDALKIVAHGVDSMRSSSFSAIIVTHYARILEYIKPDVVHVMVRGRIAQSGDSTLAHTLEKEGYTSFGLHAGDGKIALQ